MSAAPPAVLFDAADTLFELVPAPADLLTRDWLGADGAPAAEGVRAALVDLGAEDRWPDYETDAGVRLASWTGFFREALRRSGGADSAEAAARAARYALEPRNYHCYPDVHACLARLRAAGHQTALVSNFDQWLHEILDAHELSALFDTLVVSAEVGVQKPAPEIFAIACARLDREPGDCVFVGDSVAVDVRGSAGAGMRPILLDRYGRVADFDGACIRTLEPLPAMLAGAR